MTMFRPERAVVLARSVPAGQTYGGERGARGVVPDREAEERERLRRYLAEQERLAEVQARSGVVEIDGEEFDAKGRGVVDNTASRNNRQGLASTALCPGRRPRGVLVKLIHGFFDQDGFWCMKKADGRIEVYRGAGKDTMRRLTEDQRRLLNNARLRARKAGVR